MSPFPSQALRAAVLGLLVVLGLASQSQAADVVYVSDAPRYAEYIELLRSALKRTEATHGPFTMAPARVDMNESRFLLEARTGELVNVVWSATSREKEERLIPIRIPLEKGLLGYRISLIQASQQTDFHGLNNVRQLSRRRFCLGMGWGDVAIYRAAQLQVVLGQYEALFRMTELGRCDLFSRGVNEVFDEFDRVRGAHPGLAIEQELLLHYPYPFYFFVSPKHPEMAQRIESGLRLMLADGSFDANFWRHNGYAIERARIARRQVIELSNPDLPDGTPLEDRRLWFRPGDQPPSGMDTRESRPP